MTTLVFLGIVIDTMNFQVRLPREKVHFLQALLQDWSSNKVWTRKDQESLIGHLAHTASVV